MMMSFVYMQQRSHERTDQAFLVVLHCTILECELDKMEERQPHLGHVDNQTSCLLVFLVYSNIFFFVNVSMRFFLFKSPVRVKL